ARRRHEQHLVDLELLRLALDAAELVAQLADARLQAHPILPRALEVLAGVGRQRRRRQRRALGVRAAQLVAPRQRPQERLALADRQQQRAPPPAQRLRLGARLVARPHARLVVVAARLDLAPLELALLDVGERGVDQLAGAPFDREQRLGLIAQLLDHRLRAARRAQPGAGDGRAQSLVAQRLAATRQILEREGEHRREHLGRRPPQPRLQDLVGERRLAATIVVRRFFELAAQAALLLAAQLGDRAVGEGQRATDGQRLRRPAEVPRRSAREAEQERA